MSEISVAMPVLPDWAVLISVEISVEISVCNIKISVVIY